MMFFISDFSVGFEHKGNGVILLESKTLGEYLEDERKKKGLSKKAVCRGICDNSTYGRYEADLIIPNKIMLDAILERLGNNPNMIDYCCTKEEIELKKLRQEIEVSLNNKTERAMELLEVYKSKIKKDIKLHTQWVLMIDGLLCDDTDEAIDYFERGYYLTKDEMTINDNSLFSLLEFRLLLLLNFYLNKVDSIEEMRKYLSKKNDFDILKLSFWGEFSIAYLKMKRNDKQICQNVIREVLDYKRKMYQFNGVLELLHYKNELNIELSDNEQMLLSEKDLFYTGDQL